MLQMVHQSRNLCVIGHLSIKSFQEIDEAEKQKGNGTTNRD